MTMNQTLPTRHDAKAQATRLRRSLEAEGNFISHADALELVAKQYGFRDWNTLSARLPQARPTRLAVGEAVTGRYLGHAFTAKLLGLQSFNQGARHHVTLQLDQPIDVAASEHFSALRRRITGTIGRAGATWEKTSNGQPVLQLDLS